MAVPISVVIPAYNAACWISDALESVVAQGRGNEIEVVIADDTRSTDDLRGVISRDFPFARVVPVSEPGPGTARNVGTHLTTGDFIQYLDADDQLAPGKIWHQRDLLEQYGGDVAYGDLQYLEPRSGQYVRGTIIAKRLTEPELDLLRGFWCPTGAYLFRRNIVDQVGGWTGFLHYEDDRFLQDCAFQGANFIYSPGIMAYYRTGPRPLWRREPVAALREHYRYIQYVEHHWTVHGGLSDARRRALAKRLSSLAWHSADVERVIFDAAWNDLERICPDYVPDGSRRFQTAAKLLGFRRADAIARRYLNLKKLLSGV